MKKLLIIIILLAVMAGAGYFFWYKDLNTEEQVPQNNTKAASVIISDKVISPVNSYDNSSIWFGLVNGQMMKYDISSGHLTEYPLPEITGKSFSHIYWPSSGNDFIARGIDGQKIFYSYYNFAQKNYYNFSENVQALDWLNDGKRVVIVWKSGDGKAQLVVSNADTTGYRIVTQLPWTDLVPKASPKNNEALLVRPYPTGEVNKIYLFDLGSGRYEEVVAEGKNNGVLWSPTGDRFAFSRLNQEWSTIHLYDLVQDESLDLEIAASIEKIAFSQDGKQLYAAVPAENGREQIISVSLDTLSRRTLYTFENSVNARSLLVIGQKIYFVSAVDGKLYEVK